MGDLKYNRFVLIILFFVSYICKDVTHTPGQPQGGGSLVDAFETPVVFFLFFTGGENYSKITVRMSIFKSICVLFVTRHTL